MDRRMGSTLDDPAQHGQGKLRQRECGKDVKTAVAQCDHAPRPHCSHALLLTATLRAAARRSTAHQLHGIVGSQTIRPWESRLSPALPLLAAASSRRPCWTVPSMRCSGGERPHACPLGQRAAITRFPFEPAMQRSRVMKVSTTSACAMDQLNISGGPS